MYTLYEKLLGLPMIDRENKENEMNKPTRKESIETKCKDCCADYEDGKQDCQVTACPLYSYMPYRELEANLELFKYSPKHVGKVLKEDCKTKLSDEQRQAIGDRLKKARANA